MNEMLASFSFIPTRPRRLSLSDRKDISLRWRMNIIAMDKGEQRKCVLKNKFQIGIKICASKTASILKDSPTISPRRTPSNPSSKVNDNCRIGQPTRRNRTKNIIDSSSNLHGSNGRKGVTQHSPFTDAPKFQPKIPKLTTTWSSIISSHFASRSQIVVFFSQEGSSVFFINQRRW